MAANGASMLRILVTALTLLIINTAAEAQVRKVVAGSSEPGKRWELEIAELAWPGSYVAVMKDPGDSTFYYFAGEDRGVLHFSAELSRSTSVKQILVPLKDGEAFLPIRESYSGDVLLLRIAPAPAAMRKDKRDLYTVTLEGRR